MSNNTKQVGGDHYDAPMRYRHYVFVERWDIPWCLANVMKYLIRHRKKNGRQDLEKSVSYALLYVEGLRSTAIPIIRKQTLAITFDELERFAKANGCDEDETSMIASMSVILRSTYDDSEHRALLCRNLALGITRLMRHAYPV